MPGKRYAGVVRRVRAERGATDLSKKVFWVFCAFLCLPLQVLAQNQRFDIQPWRPTAGPRDLVILPQTQPLAHMSVAAGAYFSVSLNPLSLLNVQSGAPSLEVVKDRLELDLMAAVGIKDWFELGFVMPLILFQRSGGDLEATGIGGSLQTFAQGDLGIIAKVPFLRRLSYASGFGVAGLFRMNFPTGVQNAFAGDGDFTYNPSIAVDYRFKFGMLIAAQAGILLRPEREFFGVVTGSTVTGSAGIELPLVRSWGLGALGGIYFNVPVLDPDLSIDKIPAETMLGLRWYSSLGVTFTTGVHFGMNCGLGLPPFRFFLAAVLVPPKSNEKKAIDAFKQPPDDPDFDGIIGSADECPDRAGPIENKGCPPVDSDGDSLPDHLDACPALYGLRQWGGCPMVYLDGQQIKTAAPIQLAETGPATGPAAALLGKLAETLQGHPEWPALLVQGPWNPALPTEQQRGHSLSQAQRICTELAQRGVPLARCIPAPQEPQLLQPSGVTTAPAVPLQMWLSSPLIQPPAVAPPPTQG